MAFIGFHQETETLLVMFFGFIRENHEWSKDGEKLGGLWEFYRHREVGNESGERIEA